jgi:hypothetical protein
LLTLAIQFFDHGFDFAVPLRRKMQMIVAQARRFFHIGRHQQTPESRQRAQCLQLLFVKIIGLETESLSAQFVKIAVACVVPGGVM